MWWTVINIIVVEGKLVGTVCMGRKIQRCRARCGTQLGLEQHNTATTSQPDGKESQGEAKKKAIIHQASREICRQADRAKWEQNWSCSPRKKKKEE